MTLKWKTIEDSNVQHFWKCCQEDCENQQECSVDPTFYADAGTPFCSDCSCDMTYIRTEILTEEE